MTSWSKTAVGASVSSPAVQVSERRTRGRIKGKSNLSIHSWPKKPKTFLKVLLMLLLISHGSEVGHMPKPTLLTDHIATTNVTEGKEGRGCGLHKYTVYFLCPFRSTFQPSPGDSSALQGTDLSEVHLWAFGFPLSLDNETPQQVTERWEEGNDRTFISPAVS